MCTSILALNSSHNMLARMFLYSQANVQNCTFMLSFYCFFYSIFYQMDRIKRIWYLLPMRAAKVQASLHIRAVLPEPPLLAHTSSESRGTFSQKARSLAPLNGWACAVKICHDGMLEDTNSLDGAQILFNIHSKSNKHYVSPVKRICVFEHSVMTNLTAHAQPFRGARDLAFCLKVPLDSLLI